MIRWKDSVRFDGLHPAMVLALLRAEALFAPDECWITSANDSRHMHGSKHFDGKAVDLRAHHVDKLRAAAVAAQLRAALGPQFDVIHEDTGQPNQHIHVEFSGT